jgi:hypothetical protein
MAATTALDLHHFRGHYPRQRRHPEQAERTVYEVFEEERPALIPYTGPFDGYRTQLATVSKTCLVRFDHNHYSVMASAVGRAVDVQAYADRVVIRQEGRKARGLLDW